MAAELHHWERILSVFRKNFRVQGIFQLLQSMILEENFMESEYRGIGDGLNKKSTSAIRIGKDLKRNKTGIYP